MFLKKVYWYPMKAKDHLRHLLIIVIVLQCYGRPRRFNLKTNKNTLLRVFRSPVSSRDELFCPRNIEGTDFFVKQTETVHECGDKYSLCSGNSECEPGLMCCPFGCIYKCVVPQKLRTAVATDWVVEPEALTVGGNAWLIPDEGTANSQSIDCSTSVFPGIEATECPTGFMCVIKDEGDKKKQIPNRGICVKEQTKETNDVTDLMNVDPPVPNSNCIIRGKKVRHGYLKIMNCRICFCQHGEVYCTLRPCRRKPKTH